MITVTFGTLAIMMLLFLAVTFISSSITLISPKVKRSDLPKPKGDSRIAPLQLATYLMRLSLLAVVISFLLAFVLLWNSPM